MLIKSSPTVNPAQSTSSASATPTWPLTCIHNVYTFMKSWLPTLPPIVQDSAVQEYQVLMKTAAASPTCENYDQLLAHIQARLLILEQQPLPDVAQAHKSSVLSWQ